MALSTDLVQFFLNRIGKAELKTFRSEVRQLMDHLHSEAKDNPVYDKYQAARSEWNRWIEQLGRGRWLLPDNFEHCKALAYSLYDLIGAETGEASGLVYRLYATNNLNEGIDKVNRTFLPYLAKALEEIIGANPEHDTADTAPREAGKLVFIIHGHDTALKNEVQLLLMRAGVNNVVLHEQPDKGRTIIDKLIEESHDAGYAIALLTPDDVQQSGGRRARQNVVLELGYFMGSLGKSRVRMLLKGDIEMPSDMAGVLYERYDEPGAWRVKLLKELMAVGIYVDLQAAVDKM